MMSQKTRTAKSVLSKAEQNKAEKQSNLLKAAFDLLSFKDITEISISDLAKQAGIAKGTFYLFFKDKYELRDALIIRESSRIFKKAEEALEANDIRGFEDAVIFVINHILAYLESNPILVRIIRRNLSWSIIHTSLHKTLNTDGASSLQAKFISMAKRSGYEYSNPEAIFFIIVDMAGSICYSSMIENYPLPIAQMKPILFDSIRAVLAQGKEKTESAQES